MREKTLSVLNRGEKASIVGIDNRLQGPQRRRLLDLGVVPGADIKHVLDGPTGDPRAFEILGSVIALRKEQTDHIYINPEEVKNG